MIAINLLPWREKKRLKRKRQFWLLMLSACLLALVILGIMYAIATHWLNARQRNIDYLVHTIRQETKQLSVLREIKANKKQLTQQIYFIQALQNNRFQVVKLLDLLPRIIPKGMYLTRVEYHQYDILLQGRAQNNQIITKLLSRLKTNTFFSNVKLAEIKQIANTNQQQFTITLQEKTKASLLFNKPRKNNVAR